MLVVASADGSNQRVLVKGGWRARWSPDGQWILHTRSGGEKEKWIIRETWFIRSDGTEEQKVKVGQGFPYIFELLWIPGSDNIVYATRGVHCTRNLCPFDIYVEKLDGTGRKLIIQDVDNDRWLFQTPHPCVWDPLRSRFALPLNRYDRRNGIVIIDREGNVQADFFREQWSSHDYLETCWSPDGQSIWFMKRPFLRESTGGIYRMNVDGTQVTQVISDNIIWKAAE